MRLAAGPVLLLALAALLPPFAGAGGACAMPPAAVQQARDLLQDDASSGLDAGDCLGAPLATALQGDAAYYWGTLEGPAPGADANDWFGVDLRGHFGPGQGIMLRVVGAPPLAEMSYATVPHLEVSLEVQSPGGASWVVDSCQPMAQGQLVLPEAEEGLYKLRVHHADGALPCFPTADYPDTAPVALHVPTYGFYIGCHPLCVNPGA